MDNRELLQEIAQIMAAQEARYDEKLTAQGVQLRQEMREGFAAQGAQLRQEMREGFAAQGAQLRQEMQEGFAAQGAQLRQEMREGFAAQEARNDEKLAAQEARYDEKLTAQGAQLRQEMQEGFAAHEARTDEKFAAVLTQVSQVTSEIILAVGEQLKDFKEEIIREVRTLTENIEGKKIRVLADESQAHKEMLTDHEHRIEHLERASV